MTSRFVNAIYPIRNFNINWRYSTYKLCRIISAGAITAGGAYYYLQPGTSPSTSQHAPSESQSTNRGNNTNTKDKQEPPQQSKSKKLPHSQLHGPDGYADDKPKPVEERHGPSIEKHGIASEKNQHHVRAGVFSGEKFDNHIQKREDEPAKEFEKVERGKESAENGKKGK
ncbi:hypothetical protein BCR34DRAFT_597071 [Clohesyomyces aquaticus]|uniref:Uncharacterized protein n=1 Tax=Clohesyomyces aquaticus TaxID=1231657 RepID=A0A1Y2A432_9PLEO|nr:hypothetical protein BCR34DRAFT_597071 [Clohesyomyces aquaticus]